ncbi:hypothetical protein HY485_05610 [Candidatus Woesearchaeota archaeon]|nr:hypothetical protein [Candidatus Woesearchaeota archaeon]
METISYPLRIPQEILTLAKLRAKEEYLDQTTALRQLLYLGAEEYVLNLVESGRIAIGKAAELLNLTIQDIHRLAEKHGIQLGATAEQQKKSSETIKKLLKR